MATYKVTSDNFAGKKRGEVVTDEHLVGVNVDALVAGGHIEPATTKRVDKKDEE